MLVGARRGDLGWYMAQVFVMPERTVCLQEQSLRRAKRTKVNKRTLKAVADAAKKTTYNGSDLFFSTWNCSDDATPFEKSRNATLSEILLDFLQNGYITWIAHKDTSRGGTYIYRSEKYIQYWPKGCQVR